MKKVFLFVSLLVSISFIGHSKFEKIPVLNATKEVRGYTYVWNVQLTKPGVVWNTPLGTVPVPDCILWMYYNVV